MAEPFSTVVGALTLVGAVLKLSKTTRDFVDTIQGAPRAVSALSGDVSSVTEVLATLDNFLRGLHDRR